MLDDFLTWWATQMLGWLPSRFANRDRGIAHAVVVDASNDEGAEGVDVVLRRKRQDRKLGRFRLDGTGSRLVREAMPARGRPQTVILQLPPELLLEREVVLPLAVEREPERVLAYEMDRITPFNSNEVFWTYAVERRDHARGRLHLRLSLVTRSAVEALMASLVQMGIGPTLLEVRNADGIRRQIALRRPDSRYQRLARQSFVVAASACGVLAVATVALPFVLQSVALGRVDAHMRAIRPLVAEAEALRHKIATNTASVDVIEAERVRVGDTLEVLATLTGLLPDDTFLTDFAMRQGKLTLNGQSAAAVRLIAALSGDAAIRNPEFVAPVTRVDNRADLFAIRAEVAR